MLSEKLTSIETETRRQLLMLLFQNSLSSYLQNLLVCGAVAFVIMQHSSAGHVLSPLGWLVGVAVLNLPFFFLTRYFLRNPSSLEGGKALARAERMELCSTICMGGGWTVGIFAYAPSGDIEFRLFLSTILAGMGAGAVPKLTGSPPYTQVFFGLLAGPLILTTLMAGTRLDYLIAAGVVLYTVALLSSASQLHKALVASTRLGIERLSLLASTREALVRAEQASQAKSEFLANMSHEIRTPINSILGITQVMRRGDVSPGQAGQLARIHTATEHLLGVISNILDLSKIEAGKMALGTSDFTIDEILERVLSLVSRDAGSKGLELKVDSDPLPLRLLCDSVRVTQALLNYANNAIKFTKRGGITIRVRRKAETDRRILLHFEVEDTGIGIAPEHFVCLFSAFEQANASIAREYGGSGLGLVITRHLARLMGGEAGGRSEPGVGSTFWFTVWLGKQRTELNDGSPNVSLHAAEEVLRRDHAGRRILLVDDDENNRDLALEIFEPTGLTVDMAFNGMEAIEMAGETAYDLILMDMRMPHMDGLEATRMIRRLPEHARTPILAMTGNTFREDKEECLESGMDDFIPKPVRLEELYTKLLEWLPKSGQV